MTQYEVLSQASTFCVRRPGKSKPWFLTSSHVVAPWLWPNYYPQEWVQFVEPKHTRYTVEFQIPPTSVSTPHLADGIPLPAKDVIRFELDGRSMATHPERDVAAGTLLSVSGMEVCGDVEGLITPVDLRVPPPAEGTACFAVGHALEEEESSDSFPFDGGATEKQLLSNDEDDDDSREQVLCSVAGTIFARTTHQSFLRTESILVPGMCGGPCLEGDKNYQTSSLPSCVGMIEGTVPGELEDGGLAGCAAFIESDDLVTWLNCLNQ